MSCIIITAIKLTEGHDNNKSSHVVSYLPWEILQFSIIPIALHSTNVPNWYFSLVFFECLWWATKLYTTALFQRSQQNSQLFSFYDYFNLFLFFQLHVHNNPSGLVELIHCFYQSTCQYRKVISWDHKRKMQTWSLSLYRLFANFSSLPTHKVNYLVCGTMRICETTCERFLRFSETVQKTGRV